MGAKDVLLGKMLGSAAKLSDRQVAETIALLLRHAAKNNASDIHIEPHERWALVRYRIDGSLGGVYKLPLGSLAALVTQFKANANMSPGSHEMPESGSYHTEIDGAAFAISISTMPVIGGEKVVLHLTPKTHAIPLEALGFWGEGLALLRIMLARSHGLLLVASPKRNGKSTTLRSLVDILNRPTVSIATIETTIEHRMPGVAQTQVDNARTTFADSLQAVLRQDPNIIMLEQLPDNTAAKLAVYAAGSGHFVLAGLHADDALHALLHVEAMGVEPFVLGHCLQGILSQRLVRKLCEHCRERYILSHEEQAALTKAFGITSVAAQKRVHELERQAIEAKISSDARPNTTTTHVTHLWRANPEGCSECHHSGFSGQISVIEVLGNGPNLQKAFLSPKTASSLHAAALKDGFVPLMLDGFIKALRGQTTVEQILQHFAPSAKT